MAWDDSSFSRTCVSPGKSSKGIYLPRCGVGHGGGGDTPGQVPLKSHQASSLQNQPQLWFYSSGPLRELGQSQPGTWWGTQYISNANFCSNSFFRQTHRESFSTPPPPFLLLLSFLLPYPSYPLAFLLLLSLFHFMNHDKISIQDKNVLYFTLLAVIKFCPLQGHCRFHGNQYTQKLRRTTV